MQTEAGWSAACVCWQGCADSTSWLPQPFLPCCAGQAAFRLLLLYAPLQQLCLQQTGLTSSNMALCCRHLAASDSLRVLQLGPAADGPANSTHAPLQEASLPQQDPVVWALQGLVAHLQKQQLQVLQLWGLSEQQEAEVQGSWSNCRGTAVHSSRLDGGGVRLCVLAGWVSGSLQAQFEADG